MGTLVNGIKEIFATSQTTATHLPVCASDGTPQGRISVGDLASVLGGLQFRGNVNWSNVDSTRTQGVYMTTGAPYGDGYCQLIVTRWTSDASDVHQVVISSKENHKYQSYERFSSNGGSVWGSWLPVIPQFYKDYNNLTSLATALGRKNELFTFAGLEQYILNKSTPAVITNGVYVYGHSSITYGLFKVVNGNAYEIFELGADLAFTKIDDNSTTVELKQESYGSYRTLRCLAH